MTSLADRAIAAASADADARALEAQARYVRRRAEALDAINKALAPFDLTVDEADLDKNPTAPGGRFVTSKIPVTDDAALVVSWDGEKRPAEVKLYPCDQLYWDLPPGQETKPVGAGASPSCYGLGYPVVTSLSELGAALTKVVIARASWRSKHGADR